MQSVPEDNLNGGKRIAELWHFEYPNCSNEFLWGIFYLQCRLKIEDWRLRFTYMHHRWIVCQKISQIFRREMYFIAYKSFLKFQVIRHMTYLVRSQVIISCDNCMRCRIKFQKHCVSYNAFSRKISKVICAKKWRDNISHHNYFWYLIKKCKH